MPLKAVASTSISDGRTLVVQVWDKSLRAKVEKAIRESNMGLNPEIRGDALYIPVPSLTQEARKKWAKIVEDYTENAKITLRGLRRDHLNTLKKLQKDKVLPEDLQKKLAQDVQKLLDDVIKTIEKMAETKKDEIFSGH